ncbi:MAG: VOC family protein [Geminicoccaceae bacterium]
MAATPATQGLSAYLTVRDGAAAIRFYCEALGAELRLRQMAQDGKRILHAELALNGSILMLADEFPELTRAAAPRADEPPAVSITMNLAQPASVDRLTASAVAHGAEIEIGPIDAFWGARFAAFRDPFGHRWMLNAARLA